MTKQELLEATQEHYPQLLEEVEAFLHISDTQDSTWVGSRELYLVSRNGGEYRLRKDGQHKQVKPKLQKMKKYPKIQHTPKNLLDMRG